MKNSICDKKKMSITRCPNDDEEGNKNTELSIDMYYDENEKLF